MGIACTKLEGFYLSFYYAIEISACKHILTFLRGERGGKREGEGERGKGREEERVREREGERENVRLGGCREWQKVLKVPKGNTIREEFGKVRGG